MFQFIVLLPLLLCDVYKVPIFYSWFDMWANSRIIQATLFFIFFLIAPLIYRVFGYKDGEWEGDCDSGSFFHRFCVTIFLFVFLLAPFFMIIDAIGEKNVSVEISYIFDLMKKPLSLLIAFVFFYLVSLPLIRFLEKRGVNFRS